MMKQNNLLTSGCTWALMMILLLDGQAAWSGKLYKWVDENGKIHYSDSIPPEKLKQEHQVINRQGITRETVSAAKTKEELAKEQAAAREEARRLALEREQAQQQAARDRILLDTYLTEDDVKASRDRRITALDASIRIAQGHQNELTERLDTLRRQAAEAERRGNGLEPIKKQITQTKTQLKEIQALIAQKRLEQQQIDRQFQKDLSRFRELMARRKTSNREPAGKPSPR